MKRKRFSEEQIIGVLKEAAAGAKTLDLCRRHGLSEQTFYRWKAKYGGGGNAAGRGPRPPRGGKGRPRGVGGGPPPPKPARQGAPAQQHLPPPPRAPRG